MKMYSVEMLENLSTTLEEMIEEFDSLRLDNIGKDCYKHLALNVYGLKQQKVLVDCLIAGCIENFVAMTDMNIRDGM